MQKHQNRTVVYCFLLMALIASTECSCASIQPAPSVTVPTTASTNLPATVFVPHSTESPGPTSTSLWDKSNGEFRWDVEIIQNGKIINRQNYEFKLQKQPFTIRAKLPIPITVRLNVYDKDDNFKKIHPGMQANEGCFGGIHTFCDYTMMGAIFEPLLNQGEELLIDKVEGTVHLVLFYKDENTHRWSKAEVTEQGAVFELNVSRLLFAGISDDEKEEVLIEQFAGSKLYLVFLVKYRDESTISEDELRKVLLLFE